MVVIQRNQYWLINKCTRKYLAKSYDRVCSLNYLINWNFMSYSFSIPKSLKHLLTNLLFTDKGKSAKSI